MASAPDVVNRFFEAYNAGNDEGMVSLAADNILVVHHNRDLEAKGKAAFREMLLKYRGIMPDKHFANRTGFHVDGDTVVVRHTWYGRSSEDIPGLAVKGAVKAYDLCTIMTVKNGLIVEYHDYG
jgi:predicted ester cyclase